ncbi:SDR family oxidoreductase [Phenylobacterium sp.]|uniref:SDR family NAD(P)-dependent oxidoreductase n=1 Tax=Phenylobacterium sp. TaxID=1871053 RepID=UPI00286CD1FF|nr:SDR family oxidoreductase [Phenylobacterium sp.]
MNGRLQDRVVIVTGATRGIGRETARVLAREGARVACTGRDLGDGASVVAEITAEGGRAIFVPHDIASEADWRTVIARAEAQLGGVYGVVNNAGAFLVRPLADTTEADFQDIYDVNVQGAFLGLKLGFEAIVRAGAPGAIVNVSSLMGQVGFPGAIAYCATKGAVTGLTKTAAVEGAAMRPQVRVNSLHPGVIWTPMITRQFGDDPALAEAFADDTPLKMIGLPQYMADAILFLISDEAAMVTGAELTVDGGRGAG